jgi:ribonucleoside-diphosphate reductase beta chain
MSEPLLQDLHNRFTSLPIVYHDINDMATKQEQSIWFVNDVDLTADLKDWAKLDNDEKHFIKYILAFFAASDGIVNENLASRFMSEVQWSEARSFYACQIFMEDQHSKMYARLIETYIKDKSEKDKLFNAINEIPAIALKAKWAQRWIESSENFATRLVAFAVVEGIFFSGAFCSIYWINEKKMMPGLSLSNAYIAKDEGLHCLFAILLYTRYIVNKLDEATIHDIFKEAVEIEKYFITEALPCSLIGMNSDMMKQYIEFCADRLITQLDYNKIYNSANPFPFMESICLVNLTNFFDTRAIEYSRLKSSESEIIIDNDF